MSKSKSLLLSLLLIIGISFSLSAQDSEVSKSVSESYKVNKGFTLGIDNKYGAIDLVNWDKNELEVTVDVIVKAESETKAQKVLDNIEIEIDEASGGVDFNTKIELKNYGKKISFEVNYKVSAPASINADLSQKYGDIFIEELSGDVNIDVKYGSIKAGSLVNAAGSPNAIILGYSDGKIKKAGKLNAKLAYSELDFGSIESYEGKLGYSELTIESLGKKLVSEVAYSELTVNSIESGIELIEIDCGYGDIGLAAAADASFSYELETKYGDISAPTGAVKLKEDKEKGPNFNKAVKGSVGGSPTGTVKVSAKYSDIKLK